MSNKKEAQQGFVRWALHPHQPPPCADTRNHACTTSRGQQPRNVDGVQPNHAQWTGTRDGLGHTSYNDQYNPHHLLNSQVPQSTAVNRAEPNATNIISNDDPKN